MKTRVLDAASDSTDELHVYKFLVVNDELVVGEFDIHPMLAEAAFGTERIVPTAAGQVITRGSKLFRFEWKSGCYRVTTPEDQRAGLEKLLRELLHL